MRPFSRKVELVASWNWYLTAPGIGFQANEGVRGNDVSRGSSARSRKPCRLDGAAPLTSEAPSAAEASTSRLRQTAARVRTRMIPQWLSAARARLQSLE